MNDTTLTWLLAGLLVATLLLLFLLIIKDWWYGITPNERKQKMSHIPHHKRKDSQIAKYGSTAAGTYAGSAVSKLDTNKDGAFDLMGQPRPVFALTLPPDGAKLHLFAPTKAVADRFVSLGHLLTKRKHSLEDMEELFSLGAVILNNNRENMAVTTAFIAERCSAESLVDILQRYLDWLYEQVSSKN